MDAFSLKSFGEKVKAYLRGKRITLQELARSVPLDYSTLSKFLNGKYITPEAQVHIQNIIKALASKEAIHNRGQATYLLDMVSCPHFNENDWSASPLNKLKLVPLKTQDTTSSKRAADSQGEEQILASPVVHIHAGHVAVNAEHFAITEEKPGTQSQSQILMVADLPEGFVPRPQEYEAVKHSLLNNKREKPTAITTALRGAGGYGKTTLALALCHDQDITAAFPDGILFITLGEHPGNLIGKVEDLIYTLSKERPNFTSLEVATAWLKRLLGERSLLIIVDDVWNAAHLKPFLQGGPRCSRLITTRDEKVLPANARRIQVDAMRQNEAIQLICFGLDLTDLADKEVVLSSLIKRLGEWPLLLTLANGVLRERVNHYCQNTFDALMYLQMALDKRGIIAFDAKNAFERNQAVASTLEVSFALLSEDELSKFQELAIFPEDVAIPLVTLRRLWGTTRDLDEIELETFCQRLHSLSLLLSFDVKKYQIQLHDVIRNYLQIKMRAQLDNLHRQFLNSYELRRWADLPLDEPYLWRYLAFHLCATGQEAVLVATVKDLHYIAKKAFAHRVSSVEADLKVAAEYAHLDRAFIELKSQIIRIGHLLGQGVTLHDVQCILLNYLHHIQELDDPCQALENEITHPFLKIWYSLPDLPSYALIRTLWGHKSAVWGCALSPLGDWVVSSAFNGTLKIWDMQTGEERLTLQGHQRRVYDCGVSPQGDWIVSASEDRTLKIWDVQTGEVRRTLRGHTEEVNGCAISPQGDWIVSASEDRTLKIWDVQTGEVRRTLRGHTEEVNGCAISPQGDWIVSASSDSTLKIWDVQTGEEQRTLRGHTDSVRNCAVSSKGDWIASTSYDRTLKIWDSRTGEERLTLQGHTDWVQDCAIGPPGDWIVSASGDGTLKVWSVISDLEEHPKRKHGRVIYDCAVSPQGDWIVSASSDNTLKIWDAHTGEERLTLRGHKGEVLGCAVSPKGNWIISASVDGNLKVWDASSGKVLFTIRDSKLPMTSCSVSPRGDWIAYSTSRLPITLGKTSIDNQMLTIWDLKEKEKRFTLKEHEGMIRNSAVSPQGDWIVSASSDSTLKIWDVQTGEVRRTLRGHTEEVNGCAISPQGDWIVSASDDSSLKIWDVQTGEVWRTLRGHKEGVMDCAINRQGDLIASVSLDLTLKVWDVHDGKCIATFYAEGNFYCCEFLPDGEHLVAGGSGGFYFLHLIR